MNPTPLDSVPIWLLFVGTCALSWAALEAGYRFGRWRHARIAGENESLGTVVGSILALFGLLLAFTVGSAASRFDSRREAVLAEANAIGTTYLRARLLPEPHAAESARLLREYVDVRVRGVREGRVQEAVARSVEIHELLWVEATRAAKVKPDDITGLYIQSLNEMIDQHAVRVQVGIRSRLPVSLWYGLYAISFLAMATVGYSYGLSTARRSPALAGLLLAFSGTMFLIADLDRPFEGFLSVSQQATIDLQSSMKAEKR